MQCFIQENNNVYATAASIKKLANMPMCRVVFRHKSCDIKKHIYYIEVCSLFKVYIIDTIIDPIAEVE